jgi:deoxyribonuclease V
VAGAEQYVTGDNAAGGVFAVVDAHYWGDDGARAALVAADDPRFSSVGGERVVLCPGAEPYRSGEFYRRELPPICAVCAGAGPLAMLFIDGYVDLDPLGRPGLGAYVHAELGIPVVGVAKNPFRTATHAMPVTRGQSSRPLYITAAGLSASEAASIVRNMAGSFRIPDAIRRVDLLARGLELPTP